MTWYVIIENPDDREKQVVISDPEHYLDAKARIQRLKKENPGTPYMLMKTSY